MKVIYTAQYRHYRQYIGRSFTQDIYARLRCAASSGSMPTMARHVERLLLLFSAHTHEILLLLLSTPPALRIWKARPVTL